MHDPIDLDDLCKYGTDIDGHKLRGELYTLPDGSIMSLLRCTTGDACPHQDRPPAGAHKTTDAEKAAVAARYGVD